MVPLTKSPFVTLQKRGTMSFNKSAHVAMGSPEAIELMYDAEEQVIGVRGVDPRAEHAYPIRETNNSTSFVVSGRAFTQYYHIDTDVSRRYPAEINDGVLCIDLKVPGTEVTARRKDSVKAAEEGVEKNPVAAILEGMDPVPDPVTGLSRVFKDEGALQ